MSTFSDNSRRKMKTENDEVADEWDSEEHDDAVSTEENSNRRPTNIKQESEKRAVPSIKQSNVDDIDIKHEVEAVPITFRKVKSEAGVGVPWCFVCSKSFRSKAQLKKHKRVHTSGGPFKCSVCGKCFNSKSHFNTHLFLHQGERSFICDVCNASFKMKATLREHIMCVHVLKNTYVCEICCKVFSKASNLRRHMLLHTGTYQNPSDVKPFCCDLCNKSFSQKGDLKRHLVIHTQEKPASCDICNMSFTQKYSLVRHMRRRHMGGEKHRYVCDVCAVSFAHKRILEKHCRTHLNAEIH